MRRGQGWRAVLLAAGLLFFLSFSLKNSPRIPGEFCREMVLEKMGKMMAELSASLAIADQSDVPGTKNKLKEHYHSARRYYKQIEFFIEYYSPFEAKFFINGPLVPKVEMEISSIPFEPQGFQVIEEQLFGPEQPDHARLKKEYALLLDKLDILKQHYASIGIEDNKLNEALKLEVVRIMCLTLNGYDCTINKEAVTEAVYCLEGIEKILACYEDDDQSAASRRLLKTCLGRIKKAKKTLKKHPGSDAFDRLEFITAYLDPVFSAISEQSKSLGIPPSPIRYAVNLNSPSFFAAGSINKQQFSVYVEDTLNLDRQAELGALLFYDPLLSGNFKRACASCHQPGKAFSDGMAKSLAYDGVHRLDRNSPSLVNAAYQKLFFHDGRVFNLEGQADQVMNNAFEMNSSAAEIISRLKQSSEYRELFSNAFKNKPDSVITFYAVIKSITEFIKTLDAGNSRLDLYLRGDKKALTADEKNGFNLFTGKALCASCHFFPLFNGTVPPMYTDNEFEVLGVPAKENGSEIDPDPGREKITHAGIHRFAFKTPGLRNIALTGPYMHNGVYTTLDSVLTFYNRGGGAGSGMKIGNQTLPFDSLGLSVKELGDLKKFLLALTDTSSLPKAPVRLPAFSKAQWNKRKIGGEY